MPPRRVTLIRHGQAEHNVNERYHLHDPPLTTLGETQCHNLATLFPTEPPIDLLLVSPLKRTIQTAVLAFEEQLKERKELRLLLLPELQETSAEPCDTGSERGVVEAWVRSLGVPDEKVLGLETLVEGWNSKEGRWSPDHQVLNERAKWCRRWIAEREEEHVVCVLHGGFLHFLTDDWTGHGDLPGTGWSNTEFRSYSMMPKASGEDWGMIETEDSRARRSPKPLGKTETMELGKVKERRESLDQAKRETEDLRERSKEQAQKEKGAEAVEVEA